MSRRSRAALLVAMLLVPFTALAQLEKPAGEVLLTVMGPIGARNAGDTAILDRALLESLPVTEFETSTIWTEGRHRYTGVSLKDFVEALQVRAAGIKATALNDYAVEIPMSDAVEGGPIIAYAQDGEPMSVRDKGPLWIVYPFDDDPKYRSELIYSRSIWQLDRLQFIK